MGKILRTVATAVAFILVCFSLSAQRLTSRSEIDGATGVDKGITYEHAEVHSGRHYTFTVFDADLDVADTMGYIITTPNTSRWSHIVFTVAGQLATEVKLFETTTRTKGAAQTVYNNDRNSANTAGTTIHLMDDGGANGTVITSDRFGIDTGLGSNRIAGGGGSRGTQEWILKQNTQYLFTVISFTENNIVSIKLSWYEHAN